MGYSPSQQALIDEFSALKGWENRYRQIMRIGKLLPIMSDALKTDDVLLAGCESNVWFYAKQQDDSLLLEISSDAKIVKGLIAIIIAAHQSLTLTQIVQFDCEKFFVDLGLLNHLSPSRGNGIRAIIHAIGQAAKVD